VHEGLILYLGTTLGLAAVLWLVPLKRRSFLGQAKDAAQSLLAAALWPLWLVAALAAIGWQVRRILTRTRWRGARWTKGVRS
jgi:hypothetical protein